LTFVVIEGIEGSGKSTLMGALGAALRGEGYDVVMTREPGGTAVGDAVRKIFLDEPIRIAPWAEVLLVTAARAQHVCDVIRPALASGRIVLCDRFTDSTLAYQGYGRDLELESVRDVCAIAADGIEPNLTLVVDVPVSVARSRMRERPGVADRIEREDNAFHERVRQGFLSLAQGSSRHVVLNGAHAPERVLDDALDAVRALLGERVT
jgi:dTMP kinase